jgi:hypothetical protein
MISHVRRRTAALLLAAAAFPSAALAAPCPTGGVTALPVGTAALVPPGGAKSFAIELAARDGVIVDLADLALRADASEDGDADEHGPASSAAAVRSLQLCDAAGAVLAPLPGEVFAKGGSVVGTDDGERLRFTAPVTGRYLVTVAAGEGPREILVRRRSAGTAQAPVVDAPLDGERKGITSKNAPMVFAFSGTAGQWVELKSTSEKDTLLRLAGPDRSGAYAVLSENDDSDGLNPVIRRKLPVAGTYYLQVDSLSDEPGEFTLSLKRIAAPKPAPPPVALRTGAPVSARLADGDDIDLYALPVIGGHSYRLTAEATYDVHLSIGIANPVEPEDGGDKPDAGFSDVKSQDSGTTGTERLDFTARGNGTLLVRIKSFGIGETNGGYVLKAEDLGS